MAHLPILRPTELAKIVQKKRFLFDRQSGSHAIYFNPVTRKWTSIPMHRKTIGKGLLKKILRDIDLEPEDLKK